MGHTRTIGQLAKEAGVGVETVRYYERQGLIDQPKSKTGPRHYDDRALSTLKYIRTAKNFGLTLKQIKSLRGQLGRGETFCKALQSLVAAKLEAITTKEAELLELKRELQAFLNRCRTTSQSGPCPVLAELNSLDAALHAGHAARDGLA